MAAGALSSVDLFLFDTLDDLGGLAGTIAQVVKLRPADAAMAQHFDAADAGAVVRESPLNADTVGDAAHGEGFTDAATLNFDDDTFEVLEPLTAAFDDLHEYADGIADLKLREIRAYLLFFKFPDDVCHFLFLLPHRRSYEPSAHIGPPAVTTAIITQRYFHCNS